MKRGHATRTCPSCGCELSGASDGDAPVACFARVLLAGLNPVNLFLRKRSSRCRNRQRNDLGTMSCSKGQDGKPVDAGPGCDGGHLQSGHVDLRCSVTLKVISERYLDDESARLRFLREARAAASVRHPNVASVFHLGRTGKNYFYAMEFVQGETLENLPFGRTVMIGI